jgi:glycosyltransferase involved in cell wall biosynthesis
MKRNILITAKILPETTETFILAHKNMLEGNIYFTYGGVFPTHCEKNGILLNSLSLPEQIFWRIFQKIAKVNGLATRKAFKKYLKQHNIKVVVAEYGVTGAEVTPVLKELNIPLIVIFFGFDAYVKPVISTFSSRYKTMFEYANYIIAVSKAMRKQLIKLGAPKDKVVYSACGVQADFFELKPKLKSKKFTAIGRFVDKKAPYFTLMAFKKALESDNSLKLDFAGDGYLLNSVKNLADYLGLSSSVSFLGHVSHDEMRELLLTSRCFLQHSVVADNGDSEGTPVAILEAQAAGLPVISTRHGGINEVVLDKKTGFLVDEKDVNTMAKYISLLAKDDDLCKTMGGNAKKHIFENYRLEKHISELNKLIDQLMKR